MTPDDLRAARLKLGMNARQMAVALMPDNKPETAWTIYNRWENRRAKVPGPASVAIRYMLTHGLPVPPLDIT